CISSSVCVTSFTLSLHDALPIFRLNTWFRFDDIFYGMNVPVKKIKKLVDSGMLGWPLKVTISRHTGFDWKFYWVGQENLPVEPRSEEHTSELQSRENLVCRLLLE